MAIDWRHLIVRRVLGIGSAEERQAGRQRQAQRRAARAARRQGSPVEGEQPQELHTANPWAKVARAPTPEGRPEAATTPVVTSTGVPWSLSEESASARNARRTLRVIVAVLLIFFVWVGVRTSLADLTASEGEGSGGGVAELPAAATFDTTAAAGIATRLSISALEWNAENDGEGRQQAIAADYRAEDDPLDWNGKGRQEVLNAIPGGVTVADSGDAAIATVLVKVQHYTREGEAWSAGETEWLTVQVPLILDGGRMYATAGPAIVGDATAVAYPPAAAADNDHDLSNETAATGEAFFAAYATGDVSAVEAPGATITAPATEWTTATVTEWTVAEGKGDTRYATATVEWTNEATEEQITNTYRVTLTQVTGGGADRWNVSAITVAT